MQRVKGKGKRATTRGAVQADGLVVEALHESCVVDTELGRVHTRRAASCLLPPAPGDRVLVTCLASGDAYVLAVLERGPDASRKVVLPPDACVVPTAGSLTLASGDAVHVAGGKELSLSSRELRVQASRGRVLVEGLTFVGRALQAEVEKVKGFFGQLDTVLDRFSQKVKRSMRTVEELDVVRAEQVDYAAKKNMRLRAHNALLTADQLVKLDGDQVHIG